MSTNQAHLISLVRHAVDYNSNMPSMTSLVALKKLSTSILSQNALRLGAKQNLIINFH